MQRGREGDVTDDVWSVAVLERDGILSCGDGGHEFLDVGDDELGAAAAFALREYCECSLPDFGFGVVDVIRTRVRID